MTDRFIVLGKKGKRERVKKGIFEIHARREANQYPQNRFKRPYRAGQEYTPKKKSRQGKRIRKTFDRVESGSGVDLFVSKIEGRMFLLAVVGSNTVCFVCGTVL